VASPASCSQTIQEYGKYAVSAHLHPLRRPSALGGLFVWGFVCVAASNHIPVTGLSQCTNEWVPQVRKAACRERLPQVVSWFASHAGCWMLCVCVDVCGRVCVCVCVCVDI
jgi:hypothetical protein